MISLFPHFNSKCLLTRSHLWDTWHYQLLIWYFLTQSAFHHSWQKPREYFLDWVHFPAHQIDIWWLQRCVLAFFNCLKFIYPTQEALFYETLAVIWLIQRTSGEIIPEKPLHCSCKIHMYLSKQTLSTFQIRNNLLLHMSRAVSASLLSSHACDFLYMELPESSLNSAHLWCSYQQLFKARLQKQRNIVHIWLKTAFIMWN